MSVKPPLIFRDARGRTCVRYFRESYVGTYTALDDADAEEFAANEERQNERRRFAVDKWKASLGRS